jgi:hypothetical protein
MDTKKAGLFFGIIVIFNLGASGQSKQPYPNNLLTPAYTSTTVATHTATPNPSNSVPGSTAPYTTPPVIQQTSPPPAPNPPPYPSTPLPMTAPTITEPAQQPIPPPSPPQNKQIKMIKL